MEIVGSPFTQSAGVNRFPLASSTFLTAATTFRVSSTLLCTPGWKVAKYLTLSSLSVTMMAGRG